MLFSLFAFLIFLGPLIFFHELGHFALARFFGVRVEIFSLGFGKTLFAFTKGDTNYRFSLIPLGGYVKMYGENLLEKEKVPESEREFAYNHKSKWARFCIIFAGPLANFILAFVLYFFLAVKGEEIREFKVADIPSDSLMAKSGFKMGDIIKKINGEVFYTQEDMVFLDQTENVFTVLRDDKPFNFTVSEKPEDLLKDYMETSSYLIEPNFYSVNGEKFVLSHKNILDDSKSMSYQEILKQAGGKIYLFNEKNKELSGEYSFIDSRELLKKLSIKGIYRSDASVSRVLPSSPAMTIGMKDKVVITSINNKDILEFSDLRESLQTSEGRDVSIEYFDFEGNKFNKQIKPTERLIGDKKYYTIGIESGILAHRGKKIFVSSQGFIPSIKSSFKRTRIAFVKTYRVLRDMVFGRADVWNNLGGPIAIATVASNSLQISIEFFLRFMAIMSINLGLMNLLPIPVLDGGHIVFIGLEVLNGGMISREKMEFAQKIGLFLLLSLMLFVIYNDISRYLF